MKNEATAQIFCFLERAMGIEPTSKAWEAYNITQKHAGLAAFSQSSEPLNWKIMENGKRAGFTTIATGNNKFDRAKVKESTCFASTVYAACFEDFCGADDC